MAGLILKSPYLKCDGGNSVSGYLRYIGTRERVELLPDDRPPTRKQEQLVRKLVKDFPSSKKLDEYSDYGRYSPVWPDGKKHSRNVYGHTEAECEEKLAELILQMKAEIAALRSGASTEYPDGMSPKKKAIAAYLREHPGVTNKAKIARDLNMDRTTVQRYYDEIRAELRGEESPAPQT